jgi:hypothetical protein
MISTMTVLVIPFPPSRLTGLSAVDSERLRLFPPVLPLNRCNQSAVWRSVSVICAYLQPAVSFALMSLFSFDL